VKCSICRIDIVVESFERQLNPKQLQVFLRSYLSQASNLLSANEIIISCPSCDYWEIQTNDIGLLLFFCQKQECKKASCVYCHKNIAFTNNTDELNEKEVEWHFECPELYQSKKIWDDALLNGEKVACPHCGIGGRKDDGCTHMICVKCKTEYCYICGLRRAECDKEKGKDEFGDNYQQDSIMPHHVNWKKNTKRCPMYLNEISQVDKRWPDCSEACVAFLHQLKTKALLKKAIEKIGMQIFNRLDEKYKLASNCGYDMDDIMKNDHNLIISDQINL